MEVYLDVLFMMNFIMDFLILKITADVMSQKARLWRIVAAASMGGIFGTVVFVAEFNFAGTVAISFFEAAAIAFIAFYPCRGFLKKVAVMYLVSALFAGAAFFEITMFGGAVKNGVFYTSAPRVITISAIVYAMVKLYFFKLRQRASQSASTVVLEYMGKKVKTNGMIDTGNGLVEPITKKPVMLIDIEILEKLVGKGCVPQNLCEWVENDKIRFIPYNTIDGEGILTGIILDRVYIDGRCIENAVAAVCDRNLKYPVILHAGM